VMKNKITKNRLDAAIDRLASLFEYGALLAGTDPATLLDLASDEIEKLRQASTEVKEDR